MGPRGRSSRNNSRELDEAGRARRNSKDLSEESAAPGARRPRRGSKDLSEDLTGAAPGAGRARRNSKVLGDDISRSRARNGSRELGDDIHRFHFEEAAAADAQPYRLQGDERFDDPQIVRKRQALKKSTKLRSAILQFWTTLGLAEDATMTKEQYVYIHRRLARALAPDLTAAEAAEAAEEEWKEDLAGTSEMTFELYAESIYGVADLWTDGVGELDYVIFVNKLYRRITTVCTRGTWLEPSRRGLRAHSTVHRPRAFPSLPPPPPPASPLLPPRLGSGRHQGAHHRFGGGETQRCEQRERRW